MNDYREWTYTQRQDRKQLLVEAADNMSDRIAELQRTIDEYMAEYDNIIDAEQTMTDSQYESENANEEWR